MTEKVYLNEQKYISYKYNPQEYKYVFMHSYSNPQESLCGDLSVNHIVNKTLEHFENRCVTVQFEPYNMCFLEIIVR